MFDKIKYFPTYPNLLRRGVKLETQDFFLGLTKIDEFIQSDCR